MFKYNIGFQEACIANIITYNRNNLLPIFLSTLLFRIIFIKCITEMKL